MYSQTDLNAMMKIVESETVRIKNPVLLILSIKKNQEGNFAFYLFENEKLIQYEYD